MSSDETSKTSCLVGGLILGLALGIYIGQVGFDCGDLILEPKLK